MDRKVYEISVKTRDLVVGMLAGLCFLCLGLFICFQGLEPQEPWEIFATGALVSLVGITIFLTGIYYLRAKVKAVFFEDRIAVTRLGNTQEIQFGEIEYIGKDLISGGGGGAPSFYFLVLHDGQTISLPRGGRLSEVLEDLNDRKAVPIRYTLHRSSKIILGAIVAIGLIYKVNQLVSSSSG